MLKYIPYILLFALATMIVYAWGMWRSMRQQQDLSNMLSAKGIAKVKKALKKNGAMTAKELEPFIKDLTAKQPFSREQIAVTDPKKFLGSILPYMVKQKNDHRDNRKTEKLSISYADNWQTAFAFSIVFYLRQARPSLPCPRVRPADLSRMVIQFDRIDRIKGMLFFHLFIPAAALDHARRSYCIPRMNRQAAC